MLPVMLIGYIRYNNKNYTMNSNEFKKCMDYGRFSVLFICMFSPHMFDSQ